MKCPVCEDVTLAISSREGIEIDHCPQCRGVWLDRGELDKIVERSADRRPEYRDDDRRYRDDDDRRHRDDDDRRYRDERGGKRRKKRSFLEDLFEFD